ncbi:hypothetical protein OIE91_11465 [Streptomyces albidoflavus]|uniref:hypothetical protein n=1 Tax=Streptomyces albidoflavus TaxID=1886 RepID=UPI00352D0F39
MSQPITPEEIKRGTDAAVEAEQAGDYREAARLYDQLGKDIQARSDQFDPRALDAFEAMSRAISLGARGGQG